MLYHQKRLNLLPLSHYQILRKIQSSSTTYPKSLIAADLLRDGRIVRPKEEIEALLILEFFDIYKNSGLKWTHEGSI